jgi:hypothetical protein
MWTCELCNYSSYSERSLDEHIEESHPTCYTCQRMFRNHHGLRQHYLTSHHHNYCGICERDFQSPAALRGHQEIHQPRDIRCSRCDRGFPSASAMAKHVRYHIVLVDIFCLNVVRVSDCTVQCLRTMYKLRSYLVIVTKCATRKKKRE